MTATIIPFPVKNTGTIKLTFDEFLSIIKRHGLVKTIKHVGTNFVIKDDQ